MKFHFIAEHAQEYPVKQVRTAVQHLKMDPDLMAMREGAKSVARPRESSESFVLSIPAPALLTQVDEHTMDLCVVTPDGTTVASRVHAAMLICVKPESEQAETPQLHETAKEQEYTNTSSNCTFSGKLVPIDLKRFTDSGINLVECPDCGRMRSLSPVKGVLRFKPHTRRKQQMPLTEKRWSTTRRTDWDVVDG
ncbi:hypothetical protein KSZ_49900 [Dictyobacter formicarum]|uniref:Uncharacterized protein n=2 Tax=Dictyobacter formicarum TaxID=2778368 RepID=A0ABQ3VLA0_9CHLR|nr:hypothetical protein KSZ_49900 [Dictyobacter formicarum]